MDIQIATSFQGKGDHELKINYKKIKEENLLKAITVVLARLVVRSNKNIIKI